jgi:hypothetical protein
MPIEVTSYGDQKNLWHLKFLIPTRNYRKSEKQIQVTKIFILAEKKCPMQMGSFLNKDQKSLCDPLSFEKT